MKKFTFLLMIFILSAGLASAQYFGGGSIGFNRSGGKYDAGDTESDKTTATTINFSPRGGLVYSENLWFGLGLNISNQRQKMPGDPETVSDSTALGVAPFARYYVVKVGKFSVFGQGELGLSTSRISTKTGGTTSKGPRTTTVALSAFPGVSYNISDMLSLEVTVNAFRFGVSRSVAKQEVMDTEVKDITNNFNFGLNLDDIAESGGLTIGAIVKF